MNLFADFSDVIGMCDTEVQVERKPPGTFVGGVYRKSTRVEKLTVRGSLQPLGEEEIQRLPELQRTDEVFKFYTTAKLFIGDADQAEEPDIVRHGENVFEVTAGGDWSQLGNFRKYILTGVAQ